MQSFESVLSSILSKFLLYTLLYSINLDKILECTLSETLHTGLNNQREPAWQRAAKHGRVEYNYFI